MFSLTKRLRRKKYIALFVASIESLKILKYHVFSKKNISFFYNCKNEDKKVFKEEKSIEILKILS